MASCHSRHSVIVDRSHWSAVEVAMFDMVRQARYIVAEGDRFPAGLFYRCESVTPGTVLRGTHAWAALTGVKARTIANQTNPNYPAEKLGFVDAVWQTRRTGTTALLYAYAQALNHICWAIPMPDEIVGDVALLEAFTRWQSAIGQTCQEIHHALEDGEITPPEAQAIIERGAEHMRCFMQLLERIAELAGIENRFEHFI